MADEKKGKGRKNVWSSATILKRVTEAVDKHGLTPADTIEHLTLKLQQDIVEEAMGK